jgi:hypothetical protein
VPPQAILILETERLATLASDIEICSLIFKAVRSEFPETQTLALTSGSVWQTLSTHVTLHRVESSGVGSRGAMS